MGSPGEGVIDLVKEHHPDILIIGSRGLSAFQRNFATSVSEYVYQKAKIPVLVVGHHWQKDVAIGEEENTEEEISESSETEGETVNNDDVVVVET